MQLIWNLFTNCIWLVFIFSYFIALYILTHSIYLLIKWNRIFHEILMFSACLAWSPVPDWKIFGNFAKRQGVIFNPKLYYLVASISSGCIMSNQGSNQIYLKPNDRRNDCDIIYAIQLIVELIASNYEQLGIVMKCTLSITLSPAWFTIDNDISISYYEHYLYSPWK